MATQYWTFHDPVTNTGYAMPVNPNAMEAPEPDSAITALPTMNIHMWNPDMGTGSWQTKTPPRAWTFSGVTYTERQHEDLWTWVNLPNKFQLTDHLDRTWTVIFMEYSVQLAPTANQPWRHKYTIHALVYGWPT